MKIGDSPVPGDLIEWRDWATGTSNWIMRKGIVIRVNRPARYELVYDEDYTVLQDDGVVKNITPRSTLRVIVISRDRSV